MNTDHVLKQRIKHHLHISNVMPAIAQILMVTLSSEDIISGITLNEDLTLRVPMRGRTPSQGATYETLPVICAKAGELQRIFAASGAADTSTYDLLYPLVRLAVMKASVAFLAHKVMALNELRVDHPEWFVHYPVTSAVLSAPYVPADLTGLYAHSELSLNIGTERLTSAIISQYTYNPDKVIANWTDSVITSLAPTPNAPTAQRVEKHQPTLTAYKDKTKPSSQQLFTVERHLKEAFGIGGVIPAPVLEILYEPNDPLAILMGVAVAADGSHLSTSVADYTDTDGLILRVSKRGIALTHAKRTLGQACMLMRKFKEAPTEAMLYPATANDLCAASMMFLENKAKRLHHLRITSPALFMVDGNRLTTGLVELMYCQGSDLVGFYGHDSAAVIAAATTLNHTLATRMRDKMLAAIEAY